MVLLLKSPESPDFEWAVRLHRIVLRGMGIWPEFYKTRCTKYLMDIYSILLAGSILLIAIIPGATSSIVGPHDLETLIDNFQFLVPITIAMFKLIGLWQGKTALAKIVEMMAEDWKKSQPFQEKQTMIRQARLSRLIMIIAVDFVNLAISVIFIFPALGMSFQHTANVSNVQRSLVFPAKYFFDTEKSPNYEWALFAQMVVIIPCGYCYSAGDNLLILLVLHICGQLKNLQSRVLQLTKVKNFHSAMVSCVLDHIRLKRAIDIMDNTFSLIFIGVFLTFIIMVSLYLMLILHFIKVGNAEISRIVLIVLALLVSFTHTGVSCIMGELLEIESIKVYDAICSCGWENLDPRDAKNFIMLMAAASKPTCLTAGKIFPMNVLTFCSMLKASAGYISFLLAKLQ